MEIKYAIHPGMIKSAHDKDIHYIPAENLMRLYHVSPNECIIIRDDPQCHEQSHQIYSEGFLKSLIHLYPLYNGNYFETITAALKESEGAG